MKHNLYCIKDTKVVACRPPVVFRNDAEAIRAFGDLVTKDKESLVGVHPEDFALIFVGTFDLESGFVHCVDTDMRVLARGVDFITSEK